jgi:predicted DNA-binding protein with PD1-like motif
MTTTSNGARHLLLRLDDGARLPDAILTTLRDEIVLAGWMRASGVLSDVTLRTPGRDEARALAGPVHVVALEGSVGLANGDVSCGLRAVLARETDRGLETLAGELVSAHVIALEVLVTAFDDLTAIRELHPSGAWLLASATSAAPEAAPSAPSAPSIAWQAAAKASEEAPRPPAQKPAPSGPGAPMPLRPVRPAAPEEDDQPCPEAGDTVQHFAFGRCDVVKSDGDRLHLRVGKEGRIKEIALEMLRVTILPSEEGQTSKHYKLDRKL